MRVDLDYEEARKIMEKAREIMREVGGDPERVWQLDPQGPLNDDEPPF
jgi:transcriptional regulator of met regulon